MFTNKRRALARHLSSVARLQCPHCSVSTAHSMHGCSLEVVHIMELVWCAWFTIKTAHRRHQHSSTWFTCPWFMQWCGHGYIVHLPTQHTAHALPLFPCSECVPLMHRSHRQKGVFPWSSQPGDCIQSSSQHHWSCSFPEFNFPSDSTSERPSQTFLVGT